MVAENLCTIPTGTPVLVTGATGFTGPSGATGTTGATGITDTASIGISAQVPHPSWNKNHASEPWT